VSISQIENDKLEANKKFQKLGQGAAYYAEDDAVEVWDAVDVWGKGIHQDVGQLFTERLPIRAHNSPLMC